LNKQHQSSFSLKSTTISFLAQRIRHSGYLKVFELIEGAHKTSGIKPKTTFITGPSGVGKSTIGQAYAEKYPFQEFDEYTYKPVIYVSLTENATANDIKSHILKALGDPAPYKARKGELSFRIENLIKKCFVELIIIDEIHRVLPAHTHIKAQVAADTIQSISDSMKVPFVLIGLPDSIRLLQAKRQKDITDQLVRRCRNSIELAPPNPRTQAWKNLINAYQRVLEKLSIACIDLTSDELLDRMYLATEGLNGSISNIISEAIELKDSGEMIMLSDLKDAYIESTAKQLLSFNPFEIPAREINSYISVHLQE